jgi:tetratricopeptide (TPR) repeat protein
MRALRTSLVVAAAAVIACGGQVEPSPRRVDGVPLLATLSGLGMPGTRELRLGRLSEARARLEAVLASDPDQVAALNDLAVTYYLDGRIDAARQLLEETVNRGGAREQQVALVNLAELYALDGYLSAAQAYLGSARAIDASRPEPLYALALLADARGDRAGALALMRAALRADDIGVARRGFAFAYGEERQHLDALVAEAQGEAAAERWRELRAGRFPALAQVAQRHLEEP